MELSDCRKRIDELDDQIAQCFQERMRISEEVGRIKRERNLPTFVPQREREILARVSKAVAPELGGYVRMLYAALLDVSRAHQQNSNAVEGELSKSIQTARLLTPPNFPDIATVAVQGEEGANAQVAAEHFFQVPEITYVRSFAGVAQAVEKGLCKYGVLPVENSNFGTVGQVYDLMLEHKFYIARSAKMQITHSLLARPGVALENLREVYSHPQALGQCEQFFRDHPRIKPIPAENTAGAAEMVANAGRDDIGALASRNCARLYNLAILADNVQNGANNYTRFICISKNMQIYPGASRISLVLALPHRPGALYQILSKFAALGLNLLKLESRPAPGSDFEFRFYFDLAAQECTPSVLHLLDGLAADLDTFNFLGWYSEN
ncbi:MAG: chorismate mutase [Victivallales bacterium]|nr:chorismate mutase [Victivallales bacterium]